MDGHNQNMRDHHPGVRCYCLSCFREFRTGGDDPSQADLAARDALAGGVGIIRDGQRIDPSDFYAPPPEDGPLDSALNKDRTGKHGSEIG